MTNRYGLPSLADGVTLRELGVDNLRALRMEQPVELRRLTLLAGRNGIGKSTFARVFPLLRQSAGQRKREPLLWWERGEVDFGSFDTALRSGAEDMTFTFGFADARDARWTERSILTLGPNGGRVRRIEVEDIGRWVSFCFGDDEVLERAEVRAEGQSFEASDQDLGGVLRASTNELFTVANDDQRSVLSKFVAQWGDLDSRRPLVDITLSWALARLEDGADALRELMTRTAYLGPFRAGPERTYRPQGVAVDRLDPRGDNLAMFLAALSANEREDLNAQLRDKFGFTISLKTAGGHYSLHIDLDDGRYNLTDVGYGYSQMLPVIVQLWASSRTLSASRTPSSDAVVVIEQPELHLHPHQQVLMAQTLGAFAADDQGPIQIIETHSDHLIGEIGMMVAHGQLSPERVGVLCFEPHPESGTRVFMASFGENGVLHDWPVGFLSP